MTAFKKMIDWDVKEGVFVMKTITCFIGFKIHNDGRDMDIDLANVPL